MSHRLSLPAFDGTPLVADLWGDLSSRCVVMLHGGGQTRHSWQKTALALVEHGYCVLNADARGHGDSSWAAPPNYTLNALASDLHQLIETLPTKPVVVGASMGGLTALYCAAIGDTVAGLIMVDVAPRIAKTGADRILAFMYGSPDGFSTVQEASDAVFRYNPQRPRPKNLKGLMRNLRLKENGRLYWHWDPHFFRTSDLVDAPSMEEKYSRMLKSVRAPVLIIRGESSDVVTLENLTSATEHLPNVEIFSVPNAGHMIAGDNNNAFNAGIFLFLDKHFPTSPASRRSTNS